MEMFAIYIQIKWHVMCKKENNFLITNIVNVWFVGLLQHESIKTERIAKEQDGKENCFMLSCQYFFVVDIILDIESMHIVLVCLTLMFALFLK